MTTSAVIVSANLEAAVAEEGTEAAAGTVTGAMSMELTAAIVGETLSFPAELMGRVGKDVGNGWGIWRRRKKSCKKC